ncbi:hypothetical protein [Kosakonia sacchari]
MNDLTKVMEPVEFIFTDKFFKELNGDFEFDTIIIREIDKAFESAFDQELPKGYVVWLDIIEKYRRKLRGNADFDKAYEAVSNYLETLQVNHSSDLLDYRKKKIKKSIINMIILFFSEARENAYFVLGTVAINRYLDDFIQDCFLENLFEIYKSGGWPCGMKGKSIIVFDPAFLISEDDK